MKWLVDTFYLQPLHVGFLILAAYALVAVWLLPRGARHAQRAASAVGLKPITLSSFMRYLNYPKNAPGIHDLDGSKVGMPIIEGILTGLYGNFTVSLFMFTLPTGRTGTRQTVTHVRSVTEVLPHISITDETFTPKLSELLKDGSDRSKFRFRDTLFEIDSGSTVGDKNLIDKLRSVKGLVLETGGSDLYFYIGAKVAEPDEYQRQVRKGLALFNMIKSGTLDMSVVRESEAERAYAMYACAKGMFVMLPALVAIVLVGYGYKVFSIILIGAFLLCYGLAKVRYHKYRGIYP